MDFILSNNELREQIINLVKLDNPSIQISAIEYIPPSLIFANSTPNLVLNGTVTKDSDETKKISIQIQFVDPKASHTAVLPDSWAHTFSSTTVISEKSVDYTFTYDDKGLHQFNPQFSSLPVGYGNLSFMYNVTDKNRSPVCDSPLIVTAKANRNASIDLNTSCRDYDPEDLTIQYNLVSGPPGMTISSAGNLKWTVPASAGNSPYSKNFSFLVNDSKLGYQEVLATINVSPDGIPVITSIPSNMTFSEGLNSNYTFAAADPDGDPIILTISAVTPISSQLPAGSGILSNIVRAGTGGTYTFDWSFMPSWMQQIGSDGTAQLKLSLYYDPTDLTLDSKTELASQLITINIINTDDPPSWTVNPVDMTVTEGVNMAMTFLGTATDPSPNPTAVTYTMEANGDPKCNWPQNPGVVKTSAGSAYFDNSPAYDSHRTCYYRIMATDTNGLIGYSSTFQVDVTDVNQPIVLEASPPSLITGLEMQNLRIDLDTMFEDPDYTIGDDDEKNFTFLCEYDANHDGTYESFCDSSNSTSQIKISFVRDFLIASWIPSATAAGDYFVRVTVTDHGGVSVTHPFQIHIDQAPAPMLVDFSFDGVNPTTSLNAYENTNLNFYLRARTATIDPIDSYNFKVNTPSCSVQGGGTCRAGLMATPVTNTGTGNTDLIYTLTPNFTDADATFPNSTRTYTFSFTVENASDPTVFTTSYIQVIVNNVNRAPTAIGLSSGSLSCGGSSANSGTSTFIVCIDASKDTKSGSTWSKKYNMTFSSIDPDTTNDSYSYNWIESFVPVGITDVTWSFKLPSCINPGTGTINRTFHLNVSDGRGGSVQRDVQLTITKASSGGLCMQ